MQDHFNGLDGHMGAMQNIFAVILMQSFSWLANYANPVIGTISLAGSAIYVWLKIKNEFLTKK